MNIAMMKCRIFIVHLSLKPAIAFVYCPLEIVR